jgi:hypothetical protein
MAERTPSGFCPERLQARGSGQVVHSLADVIGFRMKMIAARYEDGNDAFVSKLG